MDNDTGGYNIIGNLIRFLIGVALIISIIVGSFWLWQSSSLPQINGTLQLDSDAGLNEPVTIVRDRYAIPHIYAETETDAWFSLGFVHAQDRLWQMEFQRRVAEGKVSEIVGDRALPIDILLRSLDFPYYARASWQKLDKETQEALSAYASGVNAFIQKRNHPLSMEFALLQVKPRLWTPYDSLAMIKVVALGLSGNAFNEAGRAELSKYLSDEQIQQFFQSEEENASPVPVRKWASLADRQFSQISSTIAGFEVGASNNWVVSGVRSQSGSPLLANDPHLNLTAPSIWYQAHISVNGRNLIGATIAGMPAVILGRNDNIAWGFTNTGPDTQDLFIEKINPDNANEYLTPLGWKEFETREEIFNVRFGDPVTMTMRKTRHGPVLPEETERFVDIVKDGHTVALSWTVLSEDDITPQAFYHMNKATGWIPFKRALTDWTAPMQSIVYADRRGNIGFIAPGRVPVRKEANNVKGRVPVPGWDGRFDWQGFIPFEELPQAFNPEQDYLLSANNKIVPDSYPHMITADWHPGYRARRIKQLIDETAKHDVDSFLAMQRDDFSPVAAKFLPVMMDFKTESTDSANALHLLKNWDHRMKVGKPEPLIYAAWFRELTKQIYSDETGDLFQKNWRMKPTFVWNVITDRDGQSKWCDDQETLHRETCRDLFRNSLQAAVGELVSKHGSDMSEWQWGDVHIAIHKHQPFDAIPILRNFFSIEDPTNGGATTLDRARYSQSSTRPYANVHAGGYRAVYDMGEAGQSFFMQSTGQSGNILSPHYDDLSDLWARREYLPQITDPKEIQNGSIGELRLEPQ